MSSWKVTTCRWLCCILPEKIRKDLLWQRSGGVPSAVFFLSTWQTLCFEVLLRAHPIVPWYRKVVPISISTHLHVLFAVLLTGFWYSSVLEWWWWRMAYSGRYALYSHWCQPQNACWRSFRPKLILFSKLVVFDINISAKLRKIEWKKTGVELKLINEPLD